MFPRLYGYELSFVSFLVLAEYSDEDPEIVRAKFFFRDEFLVSFCIALFSKYLLYLFYSTIQSPVVGIFAR